ncbi:hypothetical protein N7450_001809 [Penicillium hetheringtonii]|uniref:Zn(2)-C6 fungal-type domain-containing protein n=1 Tax=Penicillium hetheringtonii TaxID=911720 RepID=A0AAD6E591_9EURO|nr:hypothetical protein N7450_001809 [Penicillium hetheringtonii]
MPVKVACQACHGRRVKCDREEGTACSNCRLAGRHCEPFISRRGRRRKEPLPSSQIQLPKARDQRYPQQYQYQQHQYHHQHYHQHQHSQQEPCFPSLNPSGITPYVGDASNLNYLIQQFGNPFRGTADIHPLEDRLQAAMLNRLGLSTTKELDRINTYTTERLRLEGAFEVPSQETSRALLHSYFDHSLASLPVIDRTRFLHSLENNSTSRLLLNAVYLAGTSYCSEEIISAAGFPSRYLASLTFYRRAKALYDAGYEKDAVATIQGTFLICHWWSGLLEPKDPWYWLGISVGMAQALGMHQE